MSFWKTSGRCLHERYFGEEHFLSWRDCVDGGPDTSLLPATLAMFADHDGMPFASAIGIDHAEGWLAWLGWAIAQLVLIML